MATKPNRPRIPMNRVWTVEFTDGETITLWALHRAEARHYSLSGSIQPNHGHLHHYRRVKSVRLFKEGRET